MEKIKTKINTEGRKTEITIYEGRDALEKIVRYHNTCMVCGITNFGDADLGIDYICPTCTSMLIKRFAPAPAEKAEAVKEPMVVKPKKKRKNVFNRTFTVAKEYNPNIKIVNFVNYANLMTHHKVNEVLGTVIVDLIIKGANTPNKIHRVLHQYKLDSIYLYLSVMSNVGMLHPMTYDRTKESKYNRIFKLHKNLTYTTAE